MTNLLPVGTYTAKLSDYGITQTKEGKPQLRCIFDVNVGDETFMVPWFGSFNAGKAQEFTIKTLLSVLDLYAEPSEIEHYLAQIAEKGSASGLLNQDKDYSVVVEHNTYNNKTTARIKWVNNPGTNQRFNSIAESDAKKMFSGLGLGAGVAAFKAANPGVTGKKNPDVPF
jgi:hypothetical protein